MRRIGRIVVFCLALIGVLTILGIGVAVRSVSHLTEANHEKSALPKSMVLTVDLERGFRQNGDGGPLARLTEGRDYVLPDIAGAIAKAASDPNVKGLFATIGGSGLGMAGTQEIRDAVAAFRASGKPAVLFSESMGESGNGTLAYYLASSFGQIWLQPSGEIALQGFMAEGPYIKGFLDMWGVQPQFSGRWEYKSAIETFTESGMSAAHKENVNALLDSWMTQTVAGIALSRKLDERRVRGLVGGGPFLASEALSAGLVDQLGYRDQAEDAVTEAVGEAEQVDVSDYADTLNDHGLGIAVITGQGAIHRGGKDDPLGGDNDGFASDIIADAFRDAVDDDDVKGILFRVDSPGGSYTASDTVWREVVRARAAGKPVVVSMGDVAASGGYFVGMAADRVIAEPGTVTGSIGVFTGKFVLKDLWPRLGVNWDGLSRGDNAAMWSANHPFTPAQWDRVNQVLDQIYKDFTSKAVDGRKIPADRIEQLARGRIWSGSDALRLGVVNELGGFETALSALRDLLKVAPDAAVDLIPYPRPKSPLKMVQDLMSGGVSDHVALGKIAGAVKVLSPWVAKLGMQTQGGSLLVSPP